MPSSRPNDPKPDTGTIPAGAQAGHAAEPDVGAAKRSLTRNVLLYTVARLLMVAAIVGIMLGITTLMDVRFPLIVALVVAVIIQLPLSHLLLAGLRRRLTADMEVVGSRRRHDKAQLRAQLRGEERGA